MTNVIPSAGEQFWDQLRRHTQSRIGLERTGISLPTRRILEFGSAHALARDAVHSPLNVSALHEDISAIGIGSPVTVTSRAADRATYLRRPDLGRLPADLSTLRYCDADIGIVLCDGLSANAVSSHGARLVAEIINTLGSEYSYATPVIATQARVALGDHIGAALGVTTLLVLIGERPGLSVADSLGIYLTHLPKPGRSDSERNCISNIHPPEGLGYREAAHTAAVLVRGSRILGRSGVDLKDTSRDNTPALTETPISGISV